MNAGFVLGNFLSGALIIEEQRMRFSILKKGLKNGLRSNGIFSRRRTVCYRLLQTASQQRHEIMEVVCSEVSVATLTIARFKKKSFISFVGVLLLFLSGCYHLTSAAAVTYYNVGVLMTTKLDSPFDLERCGPAVDLALQDVNEKFLTKHHVKLQKVQAR